jgi:hypothetical protein
VHRAPLRLLVERHGFGVRTASRLCPAAADDILSSNDDATDVRIGAPYARAAIAKSNRRRHPVHLSVDHMPNRFSQLLELPLPLGRRSFPLTLAADLVGLDLGVRCGRRSSFPHR